MQELCNNVQTNVRVSCDFFDEVVGSLKKQTSIIGLKDFHTNLHGRSTNPRNCASHHQILLYAQGLLQADLVHGGSY
jgi:hypothetical protein